MIANNDKQEEETKLKEAEVPKNIKELLSRLNAMHSKESIEKCL